MKKLIIIISCFLFVITSTYAKDSRKIFNSNGSDQKISMKIGDRELVVDSIYSVNFPDSVVLPTILRKSNDQKMYFQTMTEFMELFLRSYKIGKIDKRYILVLPWNDKESYPAFKIAVNDLKLVNNRDFGAKDMQAFESGVVYPVKEVLKNGKFINIADGIESTVFKNQYQGYLINTYDSPSIIESAVEAFYANRKTK